MLPHCVFMASTIDLVACASEGSRSSAKSADAPTREPRESGDDESGTQTGSENNNSLKWKFITPDVLESRCESGRDCTSRAGETGDDESGTQTGAENNNSLKWKFIMPGVLESCCESGRDCTSPAGKEPGDLPSCESGCSKTSAAAPHPANGEKVLPPCCKVRGVAKKDGCIPNPWATGVLSTD